MEDYRKIAGARPGEIVHHIDGDSTNNDPDNLMICKSQGEHAKLHASLRINYSLKLQELIHEAMGAEIYRASNAFTEALGEFFPPKQLELIMRRSVYSRKCFSKTENEYYSRSIKPKLKALLRLARFKTLLEIMCD
jgi:hypothetical protein